MTATDLAGTELPETNVDGPGSLLEALIELRKVMPVIGKEKQGHYGPYADLHDINVQLDPLMVQFGLNFSTSATTQDGQFGAVWKLEHVSGDKETGFWPITATAPDKQGAALTYIKRYAKLAVLDLAPKGDDPEGRRSTDRDDSYDDGQHASRQGQAEETPQPSAAEVDAQAQARAEQAVSVCLVADLENLTGFRDYVADQPDLKDRDVSHVVTAADREALGPAGNQDSPFTLLALLDLAMTHLSTTGHPLREPAKT